MERLGISH